MSIYQNDLIRSILKIKLIDNFL